MNNLPIDASKEAGRPRRAGDSLPVLARSVWRLLKREAVALKLRCYLRYGGVSAADRMFADLLMRRAANAEAKQELAGACLRAARRSEARGHLPDPARLWLWYARSGGDGIKATRNIVRIARNATTEHQHKEPVSRALEAWRCLFRLEPDSAEAQRGIMWCHKSLAGFAEQAGDFGSARSHWNAILEIEPGEESATQGLRRLGERGTAEPVAASNKRVLRLYNRLKHSTDERYESLQFSRRSIWCSK